MPAAAPQGGNSDNSSALLWMTTAFLATLGGIWYGFHNQIVSYYFIVKIYEIDLITFITTHLHMTPDPSLYDLRAAMISARDAPANVKFMDVLYAGDAVGRHIRIPLAVLLAICAVIVYTGNTTRVFKRAYSMKDLANAEVTNWPMIKPVLGLDLIKTDIDTGPWAMAMTPVQFCKRFRLLEEVRPQREPGMNRKDWDRVDVVLKRGDANKLFALQLGPLWRGTANLPPYMRALFAIFAARMNADTPPATKLLAQLSRSSSGQLNFDGVDELLKKHENSKLVQKVVQSHAYVTTVMASMLQGAREDGVQASADFLWLKPMDRRLWYTLNTVGRQTPFIEVAGVFAHWVAEKEAGRKLLVPMVEEATNAVELALKDVVYRPDEPN